MDAEPHPRARSSAGRVRRSELPPVRDRAVRQPGRKLDGDGCAGAAGAGAHALGAVAGPGHGGPLPASAAAHAVRGPDRRSRGQAHGVAHHAGVARRGVPRPRRARAARRDRTVDGVRGGARVRSAHRARQPGTDGFHPRDGRPAVDPKRRHPQQHLCQRRPRRRPGRGSLVGGGSRHRLVLRGQRRQLHRRFGRSSHARHHQAEHEAFASSTTLANCARAWPTRAGSPRFSPRSA